VGTAPNVVFAGQLAQIFPNAPEVTFVKWMQVAMPLVLVFLPLIWLYLTRVAFPIHITQLPGGRRVIDQRLHNLPPMSTPERRVAMVLAATALAWIFRKPIDIGLLTIPGWAELLGVSGWVHDSTVAIAAALVLFLVPAGLDQRGKDLGRLLDWETAKTIPWGILVLFGGGLALAKGVKETGLAAWIGDGFQGLAGVPMVLMIALLCLLMVFLTEVTSNTAVSTLFMPILAALAVALGEHPVLFMLPAVLCASCAFMLPVATPPNAIVFGSGHIRIPQMARAGLILNLVAVVAITAVAYMLIIPIYGVEVGSAPAWAVGG